MPGCSEREGGTDGCKRSHVVSGKAPLRALTPAEVARLDPETRARWEAVQAENAATWRAYVEDISRPTREMQAGIARAHRQTVQRHLASIEAVGQALDALQPLADALCASDPQGDDQAGPRAREWLFSVVPPTVEEELLGAEQRLRTPGPNEWEPNLDALSPGLTFWALTLVGLARLFEQSARLQTSLRDLGQEVDGLGTLVAAGAERAGHLVGQPVAPLQPGGVGGGGGVTRDPATGRWRSAPEAPPSASEGAQTSSGGLRPQGGATRLAPDAPTGDAPAPSRTESGVPLPEASEEAGRSPGEGPWPAGRQEQEGAEEEQADGR
jgi:hypothetical protein